MTDREECPERKFGPYPKLLNSLPFRHYLVSLRSKHNLASDAQQPRRILPPSLVGLRRRHPLLRRVGHAFEVSPRPTRPSWRQCANRLAVPTAATSSNASFVLGTIRVVIFDREQRPKP